MDGYKVELIKKARDFSIEYSELLTISKEVIKEKASKLKQNETKVLALSYQDYMRFYLLMVNKETLYERMLHLIESNLALRYDQAIDLRNGIVGMELEVHSHIDAKFLSLPFIKKELGDRDSNRSFQIKSTVSYVY